MIAPSSPLMRADMAGAFRALFGPSSIPRPASVLNPAALVPAALVSAALLMGAGLSAQPASASDAALADFYSGKRLTMVIGSGSGGGYDNYSRTLGRHMVRHLPGEPGFIAQNMPGAGSVIAANHCFNTAPKDGTVLCALGRGMFTAPMLYGAQSQSRFEAEKFEWIGSMNQEFGMGVVMSSAAATDVRSMIGTPIILGSTGPETDPAMYSRLFNALIGTRFRDIHGYQQQSEVIIAMERGELDGLFISGWSGPSVRTLTPLIEEGKVKPFVQLSMTRNARYPDVPSVMEFLDREEDRQVLELIFARLALGRPYVAPPGVPRDRVQALRAAFEKTFSDPEFIADAERQNLALNPIFGDESETLMNRIFNTPPAVLERTRSLVTPQS